MTQREIETTLQTIFTEPANCKFTPRAPKADLRGLEVTFTCKALDEVDQQRCKHFRLSTTGSGCLFLYDLTQCLYSEIDQCQPR